MSATNTQLTHLQTLALRVLERNSKRNQSATVQKNRATRGATFEAENAHQRNWEKRAFVSSGGALPENILVRPYRFILKSGEGGGTYRTGAENLEAARQELAERYGDRLLVVTQI